MILRRPAEWSQKKVYHVSLFDFTFPRSIRNDTNTSFTIMCLPPELKGDTNVAWKILEPDLRVLATIRDPFPGLPSRFEYLGTLWDS